MNLTKKQHELIDELLGTRQKFTNSLKFGFGGTGILACVILEYRFKPHRQECLCHRVINFVVY